MPTTRIWLHALFAAILAAPLVGVADMACPVGPIPSERSYEGRRAAKDLEFLEWKKAFLHRLPEGMQDARRDG